MHFFQQKLCTLCPTFCSQTWAREAGDLEGLGHAGPDALYELGGDADGGGSASRSRPRSTRETTEVELRSHLLESGDTRAAAAGGIGLDHGWRG